MAAVSTEKTEAVRSYEVVSTGQQQQGCRSALEELRSSGQVENGSSSASPLYWDDDGDEDGGPKPSDLYGKYTWNIENFSKISKREIRSTHFEVGGCSWYVLIYPQGCEAYNHLSIFLCVANHDQLLPGWSQLVLFTVAVVNEDPKNSKCSDTLHRFWKKEHDWGWKKFIVLSKLMEDGFLDTDSLKIKAQVQVIRERADRPFWCLDCEYRRELLKVYCSNVDRIFHRFVEERRAKLAKLLDDKARWSSLRAFWLGMDPSYRHLMSSEKTEFILKLVLKHFFNEKESTSSLIMESLCSGLKFLEGQNKLKKSRGKYLEAEKLPVPIVSIEKDKFFLLDDMLVLLERAAIEPLPPKDETCRKNRTEDGNAGWESDKDYIERCQRRFTKLGCWTIELFVLAQIFSKFEVEYDKDACLKKQEELIRKEEAASEQKARHRTSDKEKKSKKSRGNRKK